MKYVLLIIALSICRVGSIALDEEYAFSSTHCNLQSQASRKAIKIVKACSKGEEIVHYLKKSGIECKKNPGSTAGMLRCKVIDSDHVFYLSTSKPRMATDIQGGFDQ